ncbi:hypothetical protein Q765_20660 [Flavobacterium rivuli WB 3.3-2 = DSM 21788]|uniref:Fibronectin type-III domain-containing protein n=1 Tax=Flavobacterium rivuli WB 3.3-2 = DSM 21788 TaxID=1121895 RepID=A0A0A2LW88_9FLAO|nr:GEVED domain-containing protein [Flavobacterium rivuli]KGO84612.1 hypothetical protein Q765_20660 [Flavobacterium rivuli WB 3.3-2 = DSM 21788]
MKKNYFINFKKISILTTLPVNMFRATYKILLLALALLSPLFSKAQSGETCATAINLATLISPYTSSTTNAGNNASASCGGGTSPDLFYYISVPNNYILTIGQPTAGYNFVNATFYGTCDNQTQLRCTNFSTQNVVWQNLTGTAQNVYWLQDGLSASGSFTLQWTLSPPATCPTPLNAEVTVSSPTNAAINWQVPNTGTISGYEYAVTTTNTPPASGTFTAQLAVQDIAITPDAYNYLHVRSVCSEQDGNSEWVTVSFYGGYCIPSNTASSAYYISGITTAGGETNINNTGTGFSGYTDYSASHSVSSYPGGSFSITATHPSGTYLYGVWIDWNTDFTFSENERYIFTGGLNSPANLGSIPIPANVTAGQYRMRIRNAFQGSPEPCGEHSWGEAEDYSVTVIDATGCFTPYALSVTLSDSTHANLNWSEPILGAAPTGYEYVFTTVPGPPTGNGTPVTDNFTSDEPYDPAQSAYFYVRTVCGDGQYSDWVTFEVLDAHSLQFTPNTIIVFKEQSTLQITSGNALITGVAIYDTSGRKLYSQANINSTKTAVTGLQLQQQVVIVEVTTPKGKVIKRIVF